MVAQDPELDAGAPEASTFAPVSNADEDADVTASDDPAEPSPGEAVSPSNAGPGNATNAADPFPRCCMMHVLQPGCQCGYPSKPLPKPNP